MSIATEISRLQTAKANIKASIEAKGVSVPSSTTLDGYPSIIANIPTFDPYNGHDYVEIGGLKWATMNIGATGVTDYGLYFQWGDTAGYASSNVGTNETYYAKPFLWADYKFGNGTADSSDTSMTKYNSSDGKTVLDICDDAARANWGGNWRMPTIDEYVVLHDAANIEYTFDYQGSGVEGFIYTDKTDSSKVLFFPLPSYCCNGKSYRQGNTNGQGYEAGRCYGRYWTSSVDSSNVQLAPTLHLSNMDGIFLNRRYERYYGFSVRGVLSE